MTVTDVKKFDLKHTSYNDHTGVVVSGERTLLGKLDLMVTDATGAGAILPVRDDLLVKGFIAHLEDKLSKNALRTNEARGETIVLRQLTLPEAVPTRKILSAK